MHIFQSKWPGILLLPLSVPYCLIVSLRNWCYDYGLIRQRSFPCRIISVGNITVGGTGKTPMVEFLARLHSSRGRRVCIISRGYKRKRRGILLVSDGDKILAQPGECGDEPYLLASRLSGVPVIVDKDRVRGTEYAVQRFRPDAILLDDAFQHRRLTRDVDIVLVDARRGFGNGWLLPAGPLREQKTSLKRAHLVLLTRVDEGTRSKELRTQVGRHVDLPFAEAVHKPVAFFDHLNRRVDLRQIVNKRVGAFCGIGSPDSFFDSLSQLGTNVVLKKAYGDHHRYSPADIRNLNAWARRWEAECLITTEKDRVRLSPGDFSLPLWSLAIEIELQTGQEELNAVCALD